MNCIIVDDEEFSRNVVKSYISRVEGIVILEEFDSAVKAFNYLRNNDHKVDAIFLDIDMPEMSGMDLVQALDTLPEVVLITSRKDFAVEAYDYDITDYLVKPITYQRFAKAITKIDKNLNSIQAAPKDLKEDDIYVKSDSKLVKILLSQILFVEALSDYVIINTDSAKNIVHSTMKGLEKRLPDDKFVRVHRSYIVNVDKISTIEDSNILIGKKYIPIGASYKANFMEKINLL